ncbi:hypothetical protein AOQ73_05745 [Bradyrhizobium pachyrhizi]|uniref:hypothetical protein n=1 Tax=Bradyrhizobium pachyrhizi TaxID=280333 RepID=UPI00070493AC|nr:hypothetical protein [Bradyrhizobium pachyrhizi]KRQ11910.1 hypothetical protein AOQ73_05745 [Bradyrhizobium pachyrhizi]
MTAHIKLKEFTPIVGTEWNHASYPGDGGYLTPNGVFFVLGTAVLTLNMGNWQGLVSRDSGGSDGVNVHHLLDQVLALSGRGS